ncbi:unnamed protein product [Schistocephalus solidus]|uniref:RusA family crossover junction endodeoxyribonuclease n=1 Tax=Schistocephalus solidus TaxID=70667 RepID=A0A183TM35_SCHSO|nr:unnamed protein product [Schistocephalus solidus]
MRVHLFPLRLVAGPRQYPCAREVEPTALLQRAVGDLGQWVASPNWPFVLEVRWPADRTPKPTQAQKFSLARRMATDEANRYNIGQISMAT